MKSDDFIPNIAQRIWNHRTALAVPGSFEVTDRSLEPGSKFTFPDGIQIAICPLGFDVFATINGLTTRYERYNAYRIIRTWRAALAFPILADLGDARNEIEIGYSYLSSFQRLMRALGRAPRFWPGQSVDLALEERLIAEIDAGRCSIRETATDNPARRRTWYDLQSGGISLTILEADGILREQPYAIVDNGKGGRTRIPAERLEKAAVRAKYRHTAEGLGTDCPMPIHLPPAGNARIARVARLCSDAVRLDPDLTDAKGVPIRPLVESHLPELLRRHAAAAAVAEPQALEELDHDLESGVEIIRAATEEALGQLLDERKQALQTQLRFLQLRHPAENAI